MKETVRRRMFFIRSCAVIVSGIIASAVLPGNGLPGWCAWFALIPFLLALKGAGWLAAPLYGWLWGSIYGWGGFYWLSEIHPAAGILMGPVFGAFWTLFAALAAFFWKYIIGDSKTLSAGSGAALSAPGRFRSVVFAAACASAFVFTEYLRWHILPWNAFGVTQWQTPLVRGLAAQTGVAGISFVLAGFNTAAALELWGYFRFGRQHRPSAGFAAALFLLCAAVLGSLPVLLAEKPAGGKVLSVGVIQPDLPRRKLDLSPAEWQEYNLAAIRFNTEATGEIISRGRPEVVLWPETSISTPFRGGSPEGEYYRSQVAALLSMYPETELLIGSIDWEEQLPGDTSRPGLTNSALLIAMDNAGGNMEMLARYDKQHLVPFGEYVPFRGLLPQWVIKQISMGDDLAPGGKNTPILCGGVKMGINICFEDIFDYISRDFALNGAELLAVITNDSWYPGRAEQYQHLANSVFRSVETGLPMVRCGSNSGSVVVHPDGHLESMPGLDPFEHISAAGIFHIHCGPVPGVRLFRMFGNWVQLLSVILLAASSFAAVRQWTVHRRRLRDIGNKSGS